MKVYTDGSCLGNPGRGGWGFVAVCWSGEEIFRDGGFGGMRTTNNIMELTAMLKALQWIASCGGVHDMVTVYTDSNYVRQGICSWMNKWKKNGLK